MFNPVVRRWLLPLIAVGCLLLGCPKPDRVRPFVQSSYPQPGATNIPTDAHLQVTFSEPMDQGSAQSAFRLQPATTGSCNWSGNTLVFVPSARLLLNTQHTLTVDTLALDLAGNRLESAYTCRFTTGDSTAALVQVYMLGRSVMGGWFQHWGADPYDYDRFTLSYHQVETPPDIVGSVVAIVDSVPVTQNPAIFFKLCFADFAGGDSLTAQGNLDRNLGYVLEVYDTVVTRRGLRLILGNALPQVSRNTDSWLVWNHRQYNRYLNDFAAPHSNVKVYDLYGPLTDSSGNLRPEYASDPDDSHPNDLGYAALDSTFFSFLDQNY